MNLFKLFKIQADIDQPYQEVPDRLGKDILWLMTELGELANEWRGFRYRRPLEDQQPRTHVDIPYLYRDERHPALFRNPLLGEYTDCLSIILSIGLRDKGFTGIYWSKNSKEESVEDQFMKVFGTVLSSTNAKTGFVYFEPLIDRFLGLGEMLGFTWVQIETAYIEKAEANKRRNAL